MFVLPLLLIPVLTMAYAQVNFQAGQVTAVSTVIYKQLGFTNQGPGDCRSTNCLMLLELVSFFVPKQTY